MKRSFYLKMKLISRTFIILFFALVFVNLIYQLGLVTGKNKERIDKACVDPRVLSRWEHTLELAETICVDVQKSQLDTISQNSNDLVKQAEEKTEQWRKSYFWCEDRIKKLNTNNYEDSN